MNNITDELLQNILCILQTRLQELETVLVPTEVTKVLGYLSNYSYLDDVLTQEQRANLLEKIQLKYDDYYERIEVFVVETVMAARGTYQVMKEFNSPTTLKLIVNELKDAGLLESKSLGQFNYKYNYYDIVKGENLEKLRDLVKYQIKFANPCFGVYE